jgi:hypothetical protein
MKKLFAGSLLVVSLFAVSAMADEWTGFVGDSKCAAKHTGANGAKDSACAKSCVKGGADPVFVTSDGKVLKFGADSKAKAAALAGETVKINGSIAGDTITISSIDKAGM